jgi:hypothetical protein
MNSPKVGIRVLVRRCQVKFLRPGKPRDKQAEPGKRKNSFHAFHSNSLNTSNGCLGNRIGCDHSGFIWQIRGFLGYLESSPFEEIID